MNVDPAVRKQLDRIPHLALHEHASLSPLTRFGIGGPAAVLVDTTDAGAFTSALKVVRTSAVPHVVIGGGTNELQRIIIARRLMERYREEGGK